MESPSGCTRSHLRPNTLNCSAYPGWQGWTELQNQPFHSLGPLSACNFLVRISSEPARGDWQAQIYLQPQTNALLCPFAEFKGWFVFGFYQCRYPPLVWCPECCIQRCFHNSKGYLDSHPSALEPVGYCKDPERGHFTCPFSPPTSSGIRGSVADFCCNT